MPKAEYVEIATVRIGRPDDRRRTLAVLAVAGIALAVAILKPWGDGPARQTANLVSPGPSRSTAPFDRTAPRGYDPDLFGHYELKPAWELWPAGYVYQFGISGPLVLDGDVVSPPASGRPPPSASPGSVASLPVRPATTPTAPPPGAGELVDVGAADHLVVLALNTPAGTRVLDARLWMFPADQSPLRLRLVELPPPWPVDYFHVYGIPVADGGAELAGWRPGIYRLDVLVDLGVAVRSIGVLVRPPLDRPPAAELPTASGPPAKPLDLDDIRARVAPGMIGFGGPRIDSWVVNVPEPQAPCGLAELWLAEADRPGGRCGAIVVQDVTAIALNLGPDRPIRLLELEQVDPAAVPVAVVEHVEAGATAIILETSDGRRLSGGTYRLSATLVNGERLGWYVRIP